MPGEMLLRILLAAVVATLLAATPAGAVVDLPATLPAVAGNPADALADLPIDDVRYDPATRCTPRPRPGMTRFTRWLEGHARGSSWGTYRCEKWGRHAASLHAEGR